jgi:16S rRNA (cytosine1402-N4)-methyltransferase
MDPESGVSAAEWLAAAGELEIAKVLKEYGEERFAKRIAQAIVRARREAPILTTGRLADIISRANPAWERDKHPATRSFQALRIYLNRELEELQSCLGSMEQVLAPRGRLVVISFHSLEDRMVKRYMREQSRGDPFPRGLPVTNAQLSPRMRVLGKPLRPTPAEVAANPRARSAVLRVAERLS